MLRAVLLTIIAFNAWLGLHSAATVYAGLRSEPQVADVAIVLGTRVERNGIPSRRLRERLDRAVELYRAGTVRHVIVSGGLGREGHEEAEVMYNHLVSRGIPAYAVLIDRGGYDTYETARNAHTIMQDQDWRSAVIVSHYYHLPRAIVTLTRFGVEQVSGAPARVPATGRDIPNILREFVAFYFYLFRDYGTS